MADPKIIRLRVTRYAKSGKPIAVAREPGYQSLNVLEFSPDLSELIAVRTQTSVRGDRTSTPYLAELEQTRTLVEGGSVFKYRLLRMLSPDDISITRWTSTPSLNELPVSEHPSLTEEELAWAGKRNGNLVALAFLAAFCLGCSSLALTNTNSIGVFLSAALPGAIAAYYLISTTWRTPRTAEPDKVAQLQAHKQQLRADREAGLRALRTEFDRRLLAFDTWKSLSAQHFEVAIGRLLEREGFREARTTQYSKDGGIDVTAIDPNGRPTIVQAKQYTGKVGVQAVREFAGVRQCRGDDPRAIIFSLVGFSRDASKYAGDLNIELRDIRSMLQASPPISPTPLDDAPAQLRA